jgi:hypothetical protein
MKKLMQDSGHEGFIFEKRKKKSVVNNILPTAKASEIYGDNKKEIV